MLGDVKMFDIFMLLICRFRFIRVKVCCVQMGVSTQVLSFGKREEILVYRFCG